MTSVYKSREFAETIRELCTAFGRFCDETTYNAYLKGLAGLDMADVRAVCEKWLVDGKKMPCPADIRELVKQRTGGNASGDQSYSRKLVGSPGVRTLPKEAQNIIRATVAKLGA